MFDITTLITKSINPFSLERKINDSKSRDIIYKFWDDCVEKTFYKHISENENFIYLNGKNVLYVKTEQTVMDYLNKDPTNIFCLRGCLQKNMKTPQFVYSRCFPEIYSLIDKHGINLKGKFLLSFKAWKDKKKFPVEKPAKAQTPTTPVENEKLKIEDENASKILQKRLKRKELAGKKKTG